ncbi:MAG: transporter substrate-binding domain-containing protein [Paucibacter sp.]|nr:transporter substrate-binding domain-containing protein [Roseateles sp.]
MPYRRNALLLLALTAIWALNATADVAPCDRPLRVAMSSMPDARLTDDTPIRHMLDELMPEWSRRADASLVLQPMPRVRAFSELKAGSIDIVPMATRAPERDAYAELVVMGRMKAMLIVRKDAATMPGSETELLASRLRVILVRGQEFGSHWAAIQAELQRHGRLDIVGDQLAAVRMLKVHRADAVFGLPVFFAPALSAEGLSDTVSIVDAKLAEPTDEGFYVSRALPAACRARLQEAGTSLRRSGIYQSLLSRYMPPDDRAAFTD